MSDFVILCVDGDRASLKVRIPPATTRRCGSPTAKSMRAPRPRSPISAKSTPTVSIRPTTRCPISASLIDPAALAEAEIEA